MATKKTKSTAHTDLSKAQKVGLGVGLTAAAVAAAGAYFLYGSKSATQNRKKVKGWMLKAKGEVLEGLEKAKAITEDEYRALVETASAAYGTVKSATAGEVKDFKREMQNHWMDLQKNKAVKKIMNGATQKNEVAKKATKKVVAQAKKKVAKKSA